MSKQFALVTGASSGMGYCYARQLAARGYNLLIVSNEQAIHEKAAILRKDYSVEVLSEVMDLGRQEAAKELHTYCREHNLLIEVLINNAGVYHDKDILDDSERFTSLILNLHMYTPAMLCYYFGQDMVARGKGYILNVSSITADMGIQRLGTYGSTKAFLRQFTRSLHIELRQKGVYVTCVAPGAVDTSLYNIASGITRFGRMIGFIVTPDYLVKRALRGMFAGHARVYVPYVWNVLLTFFVRLLPAWLMRLIRRLKIF